MTFGDLVEHYIARELDVDQQQARSPKAHSTVEGNRRYLKRWILPRWGKTSINEMEPIRIEDWLSELGRGDYKLENGTRLKIRNIMSVVFRHGIRHGFLPRDAQANPIKYVRQSGRSTKEHTVLTQEQAMAILTHLEEPVRTMVWLDATTGLRVSELLALRWHDIDFDAGAMNVQRGIVYNVVGDTKSDSSKSRMPLRRSRARFTGTLAARDALCCFDKLGLRQPKDERQEAVPGQHPGCEPSQGRSGKSRNHWAGRLAYLSPVNLVMADRQR